MRDALRIGIIGGGWLGGAIADSLVEGGITGWDGLTLSSRRGGQDRLPRATWTTDNAALVERSEIVLLAVRPEDWATLRLDLGGRLLVSVMAGIGIAALSARHGTTRVVRSLPNAAAEVRRSYTPWVGSPGVTAADRDLVRRIFDACGTQDELPDEGQIDYLTGLSGSGPAFPALLGAAMIDHAELHGIAPPVARRAVEAVLIGTGHLFERGRQHPSEMVGIFRAYAGTTAAGIDAMLQAGFAQAVGNGLAAACRASVRMGDHP